MDGTHDPLFMKPAVLLSLAAVIVSAPCSAQAPGAFVPTGNMTATRSQHAATLLTDGRVLITGGSSGDVAGGVLKSTEIYNPLTDSFSPGPDMREGRRMHSSTLLPDGRVLIAGGFTQTGALATAELYDPVTNTFEPTGRMTTGRGWHDAILLSNGVVLIVGGNAGSWPEIPRAEIYYPAAGKFAETGAYVGRGACDFCPPSVRLADGRVLFTWQDPGQLYDPILGRFAPTGSHVTAPSTGTLLMDGRVLLAGGEDYGRSELAEVYDPVSGAFSRTGDMAARRVWHSSTLLPDGTVLVAGGETDSCSALGACYFAGTVTSAELYDPSAGRFSLLSGAMLAPRETHTATLLNDGRVLIAGGGGYGGIGIYLGAFGTAELYVPSRPIPAPVLVSALEDENNPGILRLECRGLYLGGVVLPEVTVGGRLAALVSIATGDSTGATVLGVQIPDGLRLEGPTVLQVRHIGRTSNAIVVTGSGNVWWRRPFWRWPGSPHN